MISQTYMRHYMPHLLLIYVFIIHSYAASRTSTWASFDIQQLPALSFILSATTITAYTEPNRQLPRKGNTDDHTPAVAGVWSKGQAAPPTDDTPHKTTKPQRRVGKQRATHPLQRVCGHISSTYPTQCVKSRSHKLKPMGPPGPMKPAPHYTTTHARSHRENEGATHPLRLVCGHIKPRHPTPMHEPRNCKPKPTHPPVANEILSTEEIKSHTPATAGVVIFKVPTTRAIPKTHDPERSNPQP
ncbi:hypothetical protein BS47DRAFT_1362403 [Hydnum rufescens UP504]|uniref:Uncharacterized protein n=1 Tax=Hydnum rufescens UP504 TaxID=1448309 RepID=A0A9P6AZC7_9AGAM|nr:hypothetical protein BS47DRAFT_1362403 [Hydnum rufescens UP504]